MTAPARRGRNRVQEVAMERRNDVASYSPVDGLVHRCLAAASEIVEDVISLTMEIASIPAPTFHEADRSRFLARAMVGSGNDFSCMAGVRRLGLRALGKVRPEAI